MIFTTTPDVPGREISEVLGIVMGNVVQSRLVGRDITSSLKTSSGGEIKGYTEMMTEARNKAVGRLVASAKEIDADAIINIRFTTSLIMNDCSEVLSYGTAVKLKSTL